MDCAQLVWVCGVVQSCCSLVVVAMVSIENGTPQPSLRPRDRPSHCGSRPSGGLRCLCAAFEPAGRQAPLLIIAVVLCLLALAAPTCARAWQRMAEPTLADRE